MLKSRSAGFLAGCGLICLLPQAATPQTKDDNVLRIRTRAVFVDVLVRDKRTQAPIKNLSAGDFELLDNGKPRPLTYFSREGETRPRPLALVIALDVWGGRGISYLKKAEVAEQLVAATGRLPAADEVGVIIMEAEPDKGDPHVAAGKCEMVQALTADREKLSTALRDIPRRTAALERYYKSVFSTKPSLNHPYEFPTKAGQGGLGCALSEITGLAEAKPDTDIMAIVLTDDFVPFDLDEREVARTRLLSTGVTLNGLQMGELSPPGKVLAATLARPYTRMLGSGLESVEYLSKQTGGELVVVHRAPEFADAFGRLIDGLYARYSLGFTLQDVDVDDGKLHKLEVRLRSSKGKDIEISARRGYYTSTPKRTK